MSRDPWKWRCPRGHTTWRKRVGGSRTPGRDPDDDSYYVCDSCKEFHGDPGDPGRFEDLVHASEFSSTKETAEGVY